eukprot:1161251-Pelagomonas_calceolata.AAC.9
MSKQRQLRPWAQGCTFIPLFPGVTGRRGHDCECKSGEQMEEPRCVPWRRCRPLGRKGRHCPASLTG